MIVPYENQVKNGMTRQQLVEEKNSDIIFFVGIGTLYHLPEESLSIQ